MQSRLARIYTATRFVTDEYKLASNSFRTSQYRKTSTGVKLKVFIPGSFSFSSLLIGLEGRCMLRLHVGQGGEAGIHLQSIIVTQSIYPCFC